MDRLYLYCMYLSLCTWWPVNLRLLQVNATKASVPRSRHLPRVLPDITNACVLVNDRSSDTPRQYHLEQGSLKYRALPDCWKVKRANTVMSSDTKIRARITEHWLASERGDVNTEHAIYTADAILDYPQSGERFEGRTRIQDQRGGNATERHFTIHRISGSGGLWVSQCTITYDGKPTYTISIMEFTNDLVKHETQYFADPFPAPLSRQALATVIPPTPAADR
jgi:ketosteroid isomerase-like protein